MILRFILFALGLYIIYKVVFGLVIPIFRTTQKIRQQMGDMQQRMQDHANQQNGYTNNTSPNQAPPQADKKTRAGDYIDFEEVK